MRNYKRATMPDNPEFLSAIREAFDLAALQRICTLPEADFAREYDMQTFLVDQPEPNNFYHFKDNGANVLAVAHLDTVGGADERACHYLETEGGPVIYSRALDDRLGAYIILDLLPKLGIRHDFLLTVGEEMGQSTAAFFEPAKEYNWMIEFDRGGTDVVMYQYEDDNTIDLVEACGARVGEGIFSDISYMEHLEIKGFNWGVGYRDYHGPRAHAYLDDTFSMVSKYLVFHEDNADEWMPHDYVRQSWVGEWWRGDGDSACQDDDDWNEYPSLSELNAVIDRD